MTWSSTRLSSGIASGTFTLSSTRGNTGSLAAGGTEAR